jgi:DNA-binding CsgD family transcriptional regulator
MNIDEGDQGVNLLDRDGELEAIAAAVDDGRLGRGVMAVLEGGAGAGKSALLGVAAETGAAAGMRVLSARGGELEQGQPFGVIRQLYEPLLATASPAQREQLLKGSAAPAGRVLGVDDNRDGGPATGFAVMHAVYWLTSELTLDRPVMAIVDDAHWADSSSLHALDYLARRLADLPLVVIVAFRPDEPGGRADLLDGLRDAAGTCLDLRALGLEAVSSLVRARLPDADDEICEAVHTATAGNPLYVRELLRTVDGAPLRPEDVSTTSVRFLGDRVLRRIERVGDGASALARAMAVLGDGTRLAASAEVAALGVDQASEIAHQFNRIEVLLGEDPVTFLHPLIRASIYDTMPEAERHMAHRRAASLLRHGGAAPEEIAAHLSRLPPDGDPEVAETLAAAARTALERAAPDEAIAWLERALDEKAPRPPADELLAQLGSAKAILRDPMALALLEEAYQSAPHPVERVRVGILLAELLAQSGQWKAARDRIEALEHELDDDDDAGRTELAAIRAASTLFDPGLVDDFDRRLADYERLAQLDHWASYALSALLGAAAVSRGRPREGLAHAERARGRLLAERGGGGWASPHLLGAFILADELGTAAVVHEELERSARSSGSAFGLMTAVAYDAWIDARRGELTSAEAVLTTAIDLAHGTGMLMGLTTAAFLLIDVVLERSITQIADIVEQTELPPDFLATASGAMLLEARGRVRLARHDRAAAIADLRNAGRINEALRFGPVWSSWRSALALALSREDRDDAFRLVDEELTQARSACLRRPIGIALRTLGKLHEGAEGIDLLRESVAVLEPSPARLERARSFVELGAALRRGNRRREAREPLVSGLQLAHACGAQRLREQAEQELRAGGGRRPRLVSTGRDALTASELRVAELAVAGATNSQIAQGLYVSLKTVETHLSRAYDKLGLAGHGSRIRLGEALRLATDSSS